MFIKLLFCASTVLDLIVRERDSLLSKAPGPVLKTVKQAKQ